MNRDEAKDILLLYRHHHAAEAGPVLFAYDGSDLAKTAIAEAGHQLPRRREPLGYRHDQLQHGRQVALDRSEATLRARAATTAVTGWLGCTACSLTAHSAS